MCEQPRTSVNISPTVCETPTRLRPINWRYAGPMVSQPRDRHVAGDGADVHDREVSENDDPHQHVVQRLARRTQARSHLAIDILDVGQPAFEFEQAVPAQIAADGDRSSMRELARTSGFGQWHGGTLRTLARGETPMIHGNTAVPEKYGQ